MIRKITQMTSLIKRHLELSICILLVLACFIVYGRVIDYKFVNFDDDLYITNNPYVKSGITLEGLKWSFSFAYKDKTHWHPLTWLSHMVDCQLYGLNAGMHHLTNVLFHIANVLLLFFIFRRMTGSLWPSAFIAALFALHPINVDSVVWITNRKNVLSTFFWFLAFLSYIRYAEQPNFYKYLVTFLAFALGLMAKPILVTLPFVLLLLDYWPLDRLRLGKPINKNKIRNDKALTSSPQKYHPLYLILEKLPFLLLSGASVLISSLSLQHSGDIVTTDVFPMSLRVANALVSYIAYIGKMIWPQNLAVYYPYPTHIPIWQTIGASLILITISVPIILKLKKMPYLCTGWFWFLGTLVPVLGLAQVGLWPAMADRFAYVPLLGLFIMIAWGIPELIKSWRYKQITLAISSGLVLSLLMICSWLQMSHWKDSVSLFKHTVNVTDNNYVAYTNLGDALINIGSPYDAIAPLYKALEINQDYSMAHNNLGNAFMQVDDLEKAIDHFNKALLIDPKSAKAHNNLGNAMVKKGNIEKAMMHYAEALEIDPGYAMAHMNLGNTLAQQKKFEEAIFHFSESLRIDPNNAEAHFNLGLALEMQGRLDEAVDHYTDAVRIKPEYAQAHSNLGGAQLRKGNINSAIDHFSEALRINPGNAKLHYNIGAALAMKGDFQQATEHFKEALRIKPDYKRVHEALERISRLIEQSGAK